MTLLCKDCKHILLATRQKGDSQYEFARCAAALEEPVRASGWQRFVLGHAPEFPTTFMYCDCARMFGPCGEKAVLFKQAEIEPPQIEPQADEIR